MTTLNQDYVTRQIEMIGEMILAALGSQVKGKSNEALNTLDAGLETLFGKEADLVEMVDSHTAARLIGDPRKIRAYADLLKTKVNFMDGKNNCDEFKSRYKALYDEALRMSN